MATDPESWARVDRFVTDRLVHALPSQDRAIAASATAGLPPIQVSPPQGRLLEILARSVGARRVLEIGTLGGYSTSWLARAVPADGRVVSLEIDPRHAEIARANLVAIGLADRVEVRVGAAAESLASLRAERTPPFDFAFLDADKAGYPAYLAGVRRLLRTGALIVADNAVRGGRVADPGDRDPSSLGVRQFLEHLGADDGLAGTVVQTVGTKGYDGMAIAIVLRGTAEGPQGTGWSVKKTEPRGSTPGDRTPATGRGP